MLNSLHMKYIVRSAGTQPLTCSSLALGTHQFGCRDGIPEVQVQALLDRYVELGGNVIDTASVYGRTRQDDPPHSELLLGRWLASRPDLRHRVQIITKGAHYLIGDPVKKPRLAKTELDADLFSSLTSLKLDAIDVYILHRDDPSRPVESIIDTLNDYVRQGLVRFLGASNWSIHRILAANAYARRSGQAGFVFSEIGYSLKAEKTHFYNDYTIPVVTDDDYAAYLDSDLTVVAYNAQAYGFFYKYFATPDEEIDADPVNIRRLHRLRELCAQRDLPPAAIVLSYLTSNPVPTIALFSTTTMAHLEQSMALADVTLTPAEIEFLKT